MKLYLLEVPVRAVPVLCDLCVLGTDDAARDLSACILFRVSLPSKALLTVGCAISIPTIGTPLIVRATWTPLLHITFPLPPKTGP